MTQNQDEVDQFEKSSIDRIRLKYFANINPSKSKVADLPEDTKVEFVPLEGFGKDREIKDSEVKQLGEVYQGYTYFQEGDIAIAKITPSFENGKGAICSNLKNNIGFGTTELHILRPSENTSTKFLWYVMRTKDFMDEAEAAMRGVAGQQRVPTEYVENFRAPNYSLEQQQKIAAFLDAHTSYIDNLIDKKGQAINLLNERRQTTLTQSVTGELDEEGPTHDSGVDWLGQIPVDWEVIPLKYLVTMENGMTPNTSESRYWDGDIPWFTAKDMRSDRLVDSQDKLTEEAIEETQISTILPETTLIVVRGMILSHTFPVGILEREGTINQDMKAIKPGGKFHPVYFFRLMQGLAPPILSMVEESAHGTKRLDTDIIENLKIPVPPIDEQNSLLEYINSSLGEVDDLRDKMQSSIDLLEEKQEALITAAVKNEIDFDQWGLPNTEVYL
jgi:type I restriction enzyme S subunit